MAKAFDAIFAGVEAGFLEILQHVAGGVARRG